MATSLAAPDELARVAERIRHGDASAEDELFRQFSDRLRMFVGVRTRDPELTRDLCQEIMVHVLNALRRGQLREPERVGAFVYGTARNVVNNHFRTSRPERSVELSAELASDMPDPADQFETRQRQVLVRRALADLERRDSRILLMTLVDGLKPGDIADRLGLTSEVVRARKSRALKKMVERINELSRKSL
jgi:RNA polymerase sigma-70 factor (ECF subfamily)